MALEQQLNDTLTKAMKEKDAPTADVVRMIKSKIGERRTAKGFTGTVDDALVLDVIGAYRKQLQKALVEFERGDFRVSARRLAALLGQQTDDGPALVLLSRAVNCLVAEPDPFDPVWVLPSK